MMDINHADKMKLTMRAMLWYMKKKLRKDYGVTIDQMEQDLNNCGNPVIFEMWHDVKNLADEIKEKYHKNVIMEFPIAILWIIYRDTAYSPMFMYLLKGFFDKKDLLYPAVLKYYKEPEDMYINVWNDAKQHTKELKAKGELADIGGRQAMDEEIFTPQYQHIKHAPLIKNYEKELDREVNMRVKNKNYGREKHSKTKKE